MAWEQVESLRITAGFYRRLGEALSTSLDLHEGNLLGRVVHQECLVEVQLVMDERSGRKLRILELLPPPSPDGEVEMGRQLDLNWSDNQAVDALEGTEMGAIGLYNVDVSSSVGPRNPFDGEEECQWFRDLCAALEVSPDLLIEM